MFDAAGHPLPGANVFLKTTFDGATIDSLGRFSFATSAAGSLPLVITLIGYEHAGNPAGPTGRAAGPLVLPPRPCASSRPQLVVAALLISINKQAPGNTSVTPD